MTSPSEFFELLNKWRELGKYPPAASWPQSISFGKEVWDPIKKLYKYTNSNNHEYETSFFYADGLIVNTPPFKGEETSVSTSHKLKIQFKPASGDYFNKEIILDKKVVKVIPVKSGKLPSELKAGFLFNVHSHPIHYLDNRTGRKYNPDLDIDPNEKKGLIKKILEIFNPPDPIKDNPNVVKTYGFFSDTDIRSLLGSNAYVSGLVTDEFWLAVKTDKAISQIGEVGMEMLQRISNKAYAGDKFLEDTIQQEMKDWGLVFYRAKFGGTLRRVI